ncbi:MAG: c-type cytochrome domain-containing protein, partial [Gemmataceae bacterium]
MQSGKPFTSIRVILSMGMLLGWFVSPTLASDSFENEIRPLLERHCLGCHGSKKQQGGLRLDSKPGWQKGGDSGPAILPGRPDDSLLLKAIHGKEGLKPMPPRG